MRSFGVYPIFDDLVSPKQLDVEQNGLQFGTLGYVFSVHGVLFTVSV